MVTSEAYTFDPSHASVDFWLGYHATESDIDSLQPLLRQNNYDIFIPESADRTDEMEEIMRDLAAGDGKTYRQVMANLPPNIAVRGLVNTIFNSQVELLFIDYTAEQLAADKDHQTLSQEPMLSAFRNLEEVINYCVATGEAGARHYSNRDDTMVANLANDLPEFIESNPNLAGRTDITILAANGVNHSLLPEKVATLGFKTKVIEQPQALPAMTEIYDRMQRGQEVDRPLLVQAALNTIILPVILHRHTAGQFAVVRQIAEAVPEDTVTELVEYYQRDRSVLSEFTRQWVDYLGIDDPNLRIRGT